MHRQLVINGQNHGLQEVLDALLYFFALSIPFEQIGLEMNKAVVAWARSASAP